MSDDCVSRMNQSVDPSQYLPLPLPPHVNLMHTPHLPLMLLILPEHYHWFWFHAACLPFYSSAQYNLHCNHNREMFVPEFWIENDNNSFSLLVVPDPDWENKLYIYSVFVLLFYLFSKNCHRERNVSNSYESIFVFRSISVT